MNNTGRAFEKAMALLEDARYVEGCMCDKCIHERQRAVEHEAYQIVYPKLTFIPTGIAHFAYQNPSARVQYLYDMRCENEENALQFKGKRTYFCKHCGRLHEQKNSRKIDNQRFCLGCYERLFKCDTCGELKSTEEGYRIKKGRGSTRICQQCYKKGKYITCSSCRIGLKEKQAISHVSGRDPKGNLQIYSFCTKCNKQGVMTCDICHADTHSQVAAVNGSLTYCPECRDEEQGLHRYYYKPITTHFKRHPTEGRVSENAFHMGFELEIAKVSSFIGVDAMTHLIKEVVGNKSVYCVHDGTIERGTGRVGMEVVTHPFTWQQYKRDGLARWDRACLFLRKKGWKANLPGIGFHVHSTKSAWGSHQIYKLMKFIYGNQRFVNQIAQRKPNKYCAVNEDDFDEAVLVAKDKKNRKADHYGAINLNKGNGEASNTIEFRMFQGTLEPLYLHKNIEFVHACWNFTREMAVSHMKTRAFKLFVKEHRRMYPCLHEFITKEVK
jgi:hypothetical protein